MAESQKSQCRHYRREGRRRLHGRGQPWILRSAPPLHPIPSPATATKSIHVAITSNDRERGVIFTQFFGRRRSEGREEVRDSVSSVAVINDLDLEADARERVHMISISICVAADGWSFAVAPDRGVEGGLEGYLDEEVLPAPRERSTLDRRASDGRTEMHTHFFYLLT
jgi:hypothetical protein